MEESGAGNGNGFDIRRWGRLLSFALAGAVFGLDLQLPLGVAVPVLYVPVFFLLLIFADARGVSLLALVVTVLVLVGWVMSPPGGIPWMVVVNRVSSILAIWAVAVAVVQRHRVEAELRAARDQLEIRVRRRTAELVGASESLERERVYLETLFDASPEAIGLVDGEGCILRANGEFSRLFGYGPDEYLGRSIDDLLAPEHSRAQAASLTRRLLHGAWVGAETVRRHKDGRLISVSLLGGPISMPTGETRAYLIYRQPPAHSADQDVVRLRARSV